MPNDNATVDSQKPTRRSVLRAIKEYRKIGEKEFLKKYTRGRAPDNRFLVYENERYPLKAIFTASHTPPVKASSFNSNQAGYRLRDIGINGAIKIDEEGNEIRLFPDLDEPESGKKSHVAASDKAFVDEQVQEGERLRKEISILKRHRGIVARVKRESNYTCVVCEFNFETVYGELGRGFIEAHHKEPVAARQGKGKPTSRNKGFDMLCANCHRMIHRNNNLLLVGDLKKIVEKNRRRSKHAA